MPPVSKGLEMKEITEIKKIKEIKTGDITVALCKKLYQYFLNQAEDMDFSTDYRDKLSDFLNICKTVQNQAPDKYEPVMFYTTTTKLLSSLFSIEKQPGGLYHDTRAPLLALYQDAGQKEELEIGIREFVNYLTERDRTGQHDSNEHIFIMPHVRNVIFSNRPSLVAASAPH